MLSRHFFRLSRSPSFQPLPLTLSKTRPLCTSNPFDIDPDTANDVNHKFSLLNEQHGKPLKEVLLSPNGETLYEIGPENPRDPSFDWADFERRFGLDTVTEEEVEQGWEGLKVRYSKHPHPFDAPDFSTHSSEGRWTNPKKYQGDHMSMEFVDDEILDPNFDTQPTQQDLDELQCNVPMSNAIPRHFAHAAAEVSRAEQTKETSPPRRERTRGPDPLEQRIFSASDPLHQQPNRKRPGYERRVASIEREIEKIVEEVLCTPHSEWNMEGGELERVLLSSNMHNLTVYYNTAGSTREGKWWKKFNAKYAGTVRREMAARLKMKYVPRVFFARGGEKVSDKDELETLFQQIEMERKEGRGG